MQAGGRPVGTKRTGYCTNIAPTHGSGARFYLYISSSSLSTAGCTANALGKSVSRRPPTQQQFEPIVAAPFVSVGSRVVYVLRGLASGRLSKLKQLFGKNVGKSQTVATFLAVLELIRGGRVTIEPDETIALISRRKKE